MPTPRKLRLEIELDVTEGPRLRRGTSGEDLRKKMLKPVIEAAERIAKEELGLVSQRSTGKVEWGYTWLSATGTTKVPLDDGERTALIERLSKMPPGSIILTMQDGITGDTSQVEIEPEDE